MRELIFQPPFHTTILITIRFGLRCLQSTSNRPPRANVLSSPIEAPQMSADGVTVYCNYYYFLKEQSEYDTAATIAHPMLERAQIFVTHNGISTLSWLHHGSCAGCKYAHGKQPQTAEMGHDALCSAPCTSSWTPAILVKGVFLVAAYTGRRSSAA